VADFDVVLLGMGEDGHTASLFRATTGTAQTCWPFTTHPSRPSERVSLSAARLNRSQRVWFVITGRANARRCRAGKSGEPLPVSAVQGKRQTDAWVDQASWSTDT